MARGRTFLRSSTRTVACPLASARPRPGADGDGHAEDGGAARSRSFTVTEAESPATHQRAYTLWTPAPSPPSTAVVTPWTTTRVHRAHRAQGALLTTAERTPRAGTHAHGARGGGRCGVQQAVVCVHGLTRNGRDFDRIAERLAGTGRYRVYCVDLVGRGRSDALKPESRATYGYPLYVDHMRQFLVRTERGRRAPSPSPGAAD